MWRKARWLGVLKHRAVAVASSSSSCAGGNTSTTQLCLKKNEICCSYFDSSPYQTTSSHNYYFCGYGSDNHNNNRFTFSFNNKSLLVSCFSTVTCDNNNNMKKKIVDNKEKRGVENGNVTCEEAKRLMRLVNVEAMKMKLGMEGKEVIQYTELIKTCQSMGVARSYDEASAFARVLDDAGVILLFRDKVYLHPDKVVDLVRRAVPLALTPEDDPMRDELRTLQQKKEEIDVLAHKQVRRLLWSGLAIGLLHVGLFFRLTFWEFSWDVMEPITFFITTSGIIIGYAYFLFTARDPTYQDLMKRLFLSKQRKLFRKQNFDVARFKELQQKCKSPLDATKSIKNRVGLDLDLEDALHKD